MIVGGVPGARQDHLHRAHGAPGRRDGPRLRRRTAQPAPAARAPRPVMACTARSCAPSTCSGCGARSRAARRSLSTTAPLGGRRGGCCAAGCPWRPAGVPRAAPRRPAVARAAARGPAARAQARDAPGMSADGAGLSTVRRRGRSPRCWPRALTCACSTAAWRTRSRLCASPEPDRTGTHHPRGQFPTATAVRRGACATVAASGVCRGRTCFRSRPPCSPSARVVLGRRSPV